jgi:uncharacterized protein YjiS (DUF1127 family)
MANTLQQSTEFNCTCENQHNQPSLSSDLRLGFSAIATMVGRWHGNSRQRQALAELDSHLLADIGVTRTDAHREVRKPFWS